MAKTKIAYIEIKTYRGSSCWWAVHYYGRLHCGKENIDLERTLTAPAAAKLNLNRLDPTFEYSEGDTTIAFDTEQEIIDLAMKTYQEHFPGATVLIRGDHCCADPQPILDGPRDVKEKVNALADEAERIGYYDGGHEERMDEISNEFWEYTEDWRKDED